MMAAGSPLVAVGGSLVAVMTGMWVSMRMRSNGQSCACACSGSGPKTWPSASRPFSATTTSAPAFEPPARSAFGCQDCLRPGDSTIEPGRKETARSEDRRGGRVRATSSGSRHASSQASANGDADRTAQAWPARHRDFAAKLPASRWLNCQSPAPCRRSAGWSNESPD